MDLLAEVSVENDAAAESLYGETLPGNRKNRQIWSSDSFLEGTKQLNLFTLWQVKHGLEMEMKWKMDG